MHARFAKGLTVVGVAWAALSVGACRKSADEQRREAEQATAEAEAKASETTITSAEMGTVPSADPNADEEAREARDRAMREQAEAITAARNEQLEYRGKLQKALDELDVRRREVKKRGASHVKLVDARREVLKHHLDALDRVTDTEWAALKAKIDRDLKGDRDREGEGR